MTSIDLDLLIAWSVVNLLSPWPALYFIGLYLVLSVGIGSWLGRKLRQRYV